MKASVGTSQTQHQATLLFSLFLHLWNLRNTGMCSPFEQSAKQAASLNLHPETVTGLREVDPRLENAAVSQVSQNWGWRGWSAFLCHPSLNRPLPVIPTAKLSSQEWTLLPNTVLRHDWQSPTQKFAWYTYTYMWHDLISYVYVWPQLQIRNQKYN